MGVGCNGNIVVSFVMWCYFLSQLVKEVSVEDIVHVLSQ